MISQENLLDRIQELSKRQWKEEGFHLVGEVYIATITIATQLYGAGSPQVEAIKQLRADVRSSKFAEPYKQSVLINQCQGMLKSIQSDILAGRLGSLRLEYQGQVFADFINAAKTALSEGAKDVAAVLSCSALEDSLKRFAEANGLDVEDKNMSSVVNALKSKGLLSAQQGTLLKGMVQLRNKALHAEWSKVDEESIRSVIAFVEQFLFNKFG